ncbi:hypothetical protein [Novosphingobium sp. B 225]|uniref:hypothetical protein n=1 Tax=Novosphingobium sp. B 225 TaxID=1961849 RepID=UPI000B4A6B6B|nr:hypothetical protein [Novosphingobium sp. B 225]
MFDLERILLTIEGSLLIGAIIGLIVGILISRQKAGCIALLIVPIGMIFFIAWWQGHQPENLRSTSGLEYAFGPLWPSAGAVCGFLLGRWFRSFLAERL